MTEVGSEKDVWCSSVLVLEKGVSGMSVEFERR